MSSQVKKIPMDLLIIDTINKNSDLNICINGTERIHKKFDTKFIENMYNRINVLYVTLFDFITLKLHFLRFYINI